MSKLPAAPNVGAANLDRSGDIVDVDSDSAIRGTTRPLLASRSDSSSSSGSSHSSHSSHIEREREAHLGEVADEKPGVAKPIASSIVILLYIFALQAIALWLFTGGFLLTRTTLEAISTCEATPKEIWSPPRPQSREGLLLGNELQDWQQALSSAAECVLPATYKRSVVWIIDALRYDFIADARIKISNASTWQPNPHYHNVFSTPFDTHEKNTKAFSFLSHFLADAPTTTLQRLKGLTTGSLPTFIDAGSNFGGSAITEDNWLAQLKSKYQQNGKTGMGFVGDDTWISVFPSIFDATWTWPYDSFNVEDLDSVDRGVEVRLNSFLDSKSPSELSDWRLLVAHMLGVDHVGHRLGASHQRMRRKLEEMDTFLKNLLKGLPDDALLVLMGDHGMDEHGDHGGDSELQVGSGLWMFSKASLPGGGIDAVILQQIIDSTHEQIRSYVPFSPLPSPPFPSRGHRSVPQIDFVPTISLLLGLPIPFNNLGSVIPEAFGSVDVLLRALRINARQIYQYMQQYSKASKDLQPFQSELDAAWKEALQADAEYARSFHGMSRKSNHQEAMISACTAYIRFNRLSLLKAKSIWAQFESNKMIVGLLLLLSSLITCTAISLAANKANDAATLLVRLYRQSNIGGLLGGALFTIAKLVSIYLAPLPIMQSFTILESLSIGLAAGAQMSLLSHASPPSSKPSTSTILGISLPLLHAIAFSSNSFTFYEDRLVLTLGITALAYRGLQGYFASPTQRLKVRLPAFAMLAMIALRLSTVIRVCREEQGPDCKATFYTGREGSLNGLPSITAAYLCALIMPFLVARALNMSKSHSGVAPLFLTWMLRPALLMAAGYWLVDWALTAQSLSIQEGTSAHGLLQWAKYALARFQLALICIIGLSFWTFSPLCLELTRENTLAVSAPQRQDKQRGVPAPPPPPAAGPSQRVVVLGFANSFGSTYILLLTLVFALLFLVAQPSGQIALTLISIALFCCAEIGDGERDIALLTRSVKISPHTNDLGASTIGILPLTFLETSTIALIGFIAFFSTGHQATFDSIQWRTAFIGFETVNYPFSPLLVIINSFAPLALLPSMAIALLVLYDLAPRPRAPPNSSLKTEKMPVVMHILRGSLFFLIYHLLITFSAAVFAAHFRRHLMLFKIWTPRFMLGVTSLQISFLGLIFGLIAAGNILSKVSVTFGSQF